MYPILINAVLLCVINVELDNVNKTILYGKKTVRFESDNFNAVSSIEEGNMLNELAFIN